MVNDLLRHMQSPVATRSACSTLVVCSLVLAAYGFVCIHLQHAGTDDLAFSRVHVRFLDIAIERPRIAGLLLGMEADTNLTENHNHVKSASWHSGVGLCSMIKHPRDNKQKSCQISSVAEESSNTKRLATTNSEVHLLKLQPRNAFRT